MYLKSSEIVRIGDKNYLNIFLDKKYPYSIKRISKNGENDIDVLDMLFQEPEMSDISKLQKLGISLEKFSSYQNVKTIRIANLFSKDSLDAYREKNIDEVIEEQRSLTDADKVENCKIYVSKLLAMSTDFEDENSDYYQELSKFFSFLEEKCFRNHDGLTIKNTLSNLDKYNAASCFIKEEIVTEYISFFFTHFPSRSLHLTIS